MNTDNKTETKLVEAHTMTHETSNSEMTINTYEKIRTFWGKVEVSYYVVIECQSGGEVISNIDRIAARMYVDGAIQAFHMTGYFHALDKR